MVMERPATAKDITLEYIMAYCKERGESAVMWLKGIANTQGLTDKNGKERKITFIEIRQAFIKAYMPELVKEPQEKKPSMYELIKNM